MIEDLVRVDGLTLPADDGPFTLDEEDFLLYGMLLDPVYYPELSWRDPENHDYGGEYRVRDYQYIINRLEDNYAIVSCSRSVGKTESEKVHSEIHVLREYGKMLITAPELIHLLPLTDAVENNIHDSTLLREFLDTRGGQTGFQHRPFQCVGEGELVLTRRGHVPIEEVRVGDEVMTHRSRWRPVTHVWDRGIRDVVEIRGSGSAGLVATPDHRLYAKRVKQRQARGKTGKRIMRWEPQPADWIAIEDWRTNEPAYRMALPATFPCSESPARFRLNRSGFGVSKGTEIDPGSLDFLWVLGLYLAEGSTWRGRLTVFSTHGDEAEYVGDRFEAIGLPRTVTANTGQGVDIRIGNMALARFFEREVPGKARTKDIPTWVYGLNTEQRTAVLAGLMYGDGYELPQGGWRGSFASRRLAQSVGLLAHSLGWTFGTSPVPAKDSIVKRSGDLDVVPGHVIHAGPQWEFYLTPHVGRHVHVDFDEGLAWTAATRVRRAGCARVYDLTVTDDHSFTVSGVVVSNCNFIDGTKIIGRIPKITGTGVHAMHQPFLIVEEGQDYPDRGWTELQETVNFDARNRQGEASFRFWIYGVHSGNKASGFDERARSVAFRKIKVTSLRRPDWNRQRKEGAIAAYGGTSAPDYKRNILGEPGAGATAYFVVARVMACVDQKVTRGEVTGSDYNERGYVKQTFRAEELDDLQMQIGDMLDLPTIPNAGWWVGADLGLTDSPTMISLFAEIIHEKKPRLALMRRFTLERFRPRQIREALYAITWHLGSDLRGVGVDVTGLGRPIFQDMEDDELCPPHLKEVAAGYTFNSNVEVHVDPGFVTENQGVLRDQLGNMVKVIEDEIEGTTTYVTMMPFIAASTRFIAEEVDSSKLLLPFDTDVTSDMLQETKQRIERVGHRGEMGGGQRVKKGDRFHILDSFRAAFYRRRQDEIIAMLQQPEPESVLDIGGPEVNPLSYAQLTELGLL